MDNAAIFTQFLPVKSNYGYSLYNFYRIHFMLFIDDFFFYAGIFFLHQSTNRDADYNEMMS